MTTIALQPINNDNNDLAPAKIKALLERICVAYNINDTTQELRLCITNGKVPSTHLPMSPLECRLDNSLINFCNRVYVLDNNNNLKT